MNDLTNQSIGRVVALLRALRDSDREGLRLSEIAEAARLSKSTAHRLLGNLINVGLVEQDGAAGRFYLGFELFVLGTKAANRFGVADIAADPMKRLVERTADTVFLQIRSGDDSICVARMEGAFPIRTLVVEVGDRRPLGIGAGGLAVLAHMPDEEVSLTLRANKASLPEAPGFSTSALWEIIETARKSGYAVTEGLAVPGMTAVGVAILNAERRPIGSLSIAAVQSRMAASRKANVSAWLRTEVNLLEAELARMETALGRSGMQRLLEAG
jgi:DNA-binding IclR family transcriptional regulator